MRMAFLVQRSDLDDPVAADVIADLKGKGVRADLVLLEEERFDLSDLKPAYDLYVLRSKTPLTLSFAGALTIAGAEVANTVRACSLVRDKIASLPLLAASGAPVPPSWATGGIDLLRPLFEEGSLWLKPPGGSRGRGVRRLTRASDLDGLEESKDPYGLPLPLFAQREVSSDGLDYKVYVVGETLWAIARPYPARTLEEKRGRPISPSPEVRKAALACGRALGLEFYGVDFLVDRDRFHVVDINAFPGYKGVAEAPSYLAVYLYERARSRGKP